MNRTQPTSSLALALIIAGIVSMPANAVEIAFTGGSNIRNLDTVKGEDGIGDAWQTQNNAGGLGSSFSMSNSSAVAQPFNPDGFSNGLGSWATAFQFTINKSHAGVGFKGISLGAVDSALPNFFTVKPDLGDSGTWTDWIATYNLLDAGSALYQQVLFTAPAGTQLDAGVPFSVNVNIAGIFTPDSGWAASYDDQVGAPAATAIPEPGSLALLGLGLVGLGGMARRRTR